jgi:hypothetical protein
MLGPGAGLELFRARERDRKTSGCRVVVCRIRLVSCDIEKTNPAQPTASNELKDE